MIKKEKIIWPGQLTGILWLLGIIWIIGMTSTDTDLARLRTFTELFFIYVTIIAQPWTWGKG